MNITYKFIAPLIFIFVLISCKKSDDSSSGGTFTITTSDGKKYSTSYVNIPIPTQNGTFSLQLNKSDYLPFMWDFFILIDNNNDAYLTMQSHTDIKAGTTYSNSDKSIYLDFGFTQNNQDLPISRTVLSFEDYNYPGHIKGSVKGYDSTNKLVCTGDFDFLTESQDNSVTNMGTVPTLTTTSVSSISSTSAMSGGSITSDGGSTVTARGVCWSASQNPTTSNSKTSDGTGTGSFSSYISGLTLNTIYYVRSYSTNNSGTAYGNQYSFQTSPKSTQATISFNTYNISQQIPIVVTINTWHYVALTKASDRTGKLYIDGNLVLTDQYSSNGYNWSALYLGTSRFTSFSDFFKGWLDEIRISNIVRSSSEISANYQSNAAFPRDANTISLWHLDETSGTNFVNQVSGTSVGEKFGNSIFTTGKFGNSIYFDGANSYCNCNFDMPENNVTIEFWIKIDGLQKSTVLQPYGTYSGNIMIDQR